MGLMVALIDRMAENIALSRVLRGADAASAVGHLALQPCGGQAMRRAITVIMAIN